LQKRLISYFNILFNFKNLKKIVDFNDTKTAFELKSNKELRRAFYLFKLISYPFLVTLGKALVFLSIKLRLPVDFIIKNTVFDHFCAGINDVDSVRVVDSLASRNVSSYLHYSVEAAQSNADYDQCLESTLKTIDISKNNLNLPFVVFKPTGYGSTDLLEKKSKSIPFSLIEKKEWNRMVNRFRMTFEKAKSINIKVFVDAEESWIQPAIDEIVEEFMIEYNKKDVLIFNTVQMYRKGRLEYLKNLKNKATKSNFKIGIKLVRGAYMEKERLRARRMNYQCPIWNSKEDTDNQYNKGVEFMFDNIDLFSIFLGSHNEQSVLNAILLADKMAISKNNQNLYFGQLFGMSDNLTFTLAKNGYNSVKYLPYGPVKDVIPFLIRRAEENTSVSGQTNRELELIKSEVKRRKTIA
tara:strand:+ start:1135 stop:2364 length:1230 start_codon:yes stop_codon:yes gene_type:complete